MSLEDKEEEQTDDNEEALFEPDPLLFFPPCLSLQCAEEWNTAADADDDADDHEYGTCRVLWHCTINGRHRLTFGMREASTGVLLAEQQQESSAVPQGPSDVMDPFFFDAGYTLYAATGFSLWPGARLLMEALTMTATTDNNNGNNNNHHSPAAVLHPRLVAARTAISTGKARILELGAGVGTVGTALHVAGAAHVCMTDLGTLVEHGIQANLQRNHIAFTTSSSTNGTNAADDDKTTPKVSTAIVDWTQPVPAHLTKQSWDLIVASDCLLLQSLYQDALNTVDALLQKHTQFFFTFQRRGRNAQYTSIEQVLRAIRQERGWHCECVAWRIVSLGRDGAELQSRNELFLFCVTQQ